MSPADVPAPLPSSSLWSRLRQLRLVRWGMDLGLIVLIFVGVNAWQTRDHVRGLAPDLDVATLDGGRLSLDDLRGKPSVVVFWAPWCTVCAQEADNLDRAQELVGDRARVVTVASDYRSRNEVERYVDKHGVDIAVGLGGKRVARDWNVKAYPTAYFLDAEGTVTSSVTGYTTTAGLTARLLAP